MNDDTTRRTSLAIILTVAMLSAVPVLTPACGQISPAETSANGTVSSSLSTAPAPTPLSTAPASSSTLAGSSTTVPTSPVGPVGQSNLAVPADIDALFADLAGAAAPMTVYAPTSLPEGTVLAETWLPVLESSHPTSGPGRSIDNPRIVGSGPESEIQVILRSEQGYLAVLENFQGDLGDVSGTPVGSVDGNPAIAYEVSGGELVQWSRDGRWYGVFGRGVSRDAIIGVALGMRSTREGSG